MKTFLVIGAPGWGKSEFVKSFIPGKRVFVNDVQNEYGKSPKYPDQKPVNLSDDMKAARSRYIGGDFKEYVELVKTKKSTVVVFEEATIFLQGALNEDMRRILINKMFTKNIYILCFHSIKSVPPRVVDLADWVVLYKTNDEPYQVEKKYPSLLDIYNQSRTLQKGQYITKKLL